MRHSDIVITFIPHKTPYLNISIDLFIGNDNVLPVFSLGGQASRCSMFWTGKA